MTHVGPDVPAPDAGPSRVSRSSERKFSMPALPSGVSALTGGRGATSHLPEMTYRYLNHAGTRPVRERDEQLELPLEW